MEKYFVKSVGTLFLKALKNKKERSIPVVYVICTVYYTRA